MKHETEQSNPPASGASPDGASYLAELKALRAAELAWRADPSRPPPRHLAGLDLEALLRTPPPPEPDGEPCEVEEVWMDGTPYDPTKPDPFDEARLPDDEGPPYPAGLADPLSPSLVDAARYILRFIVHTFWSSPRWMMWVGRVLQQRKFEFLDWLRPVELLLRRLVMIEALSLLASQALPLRKPQSTGQKAGEKAGTAATAEPSASKARPAPVFDPDRPETWKVSFTVIPRGLRPPGRRYPPNPEIKRYWVERDRIGFKKAPLRCRQVFHPMLPLAKRLEAVIRVVTNPAPFARRAAFRLRARPRHNADWLLVDTPKPRVELATDALRSARERLREVYHPIWEQHWSSA